MLALALELFCTVIVLLTALSAAMFNHPDCDREETLIPPTTTLPAPPDALLTVIVPIIPK